MARSLHHLFQNKMSSFFKRRATLVMTFGRRHMSRFAAAIARADALLGRTGDAVVEDLLATFGSAGVDRRTLEMAVRSSPTNRIYDCTGAAQHKSGPSFALRRGLFVWRQCSYREVGTLTHLFARIRKKGAPPSDDTQLARTNQMRLVSIAQTQQMAQDVHDTVMTTTGGEAAADQEAVAAANKLTVLLGNALFALTFKTVTDMRDIRVLELLMRSVERFASSRFDQGEEYSPQQPSLPTAAFQQWSRHQARVTEPLANAFECSRLIAGAGAEERAAARRCGTDLALAMQALKELDLFLSRENDAAPVDSCSLPAIITRQCSNGAAKTGVQQEGECHPAKAAAVRSEQRDVADEVRSVIRDLTDGVLGYAAECEMSDDLAAFQDIAASLRGP
ncbi:hypothetical protein V5799_021815 [Amblyomma americanum]|uniref:Uncharacterized protein n=1 Tax=Amblyomma americanum TaxID=6943 RepID=A0AAQ4FMF1_AMBAM